MAPVRPPAALSAARLPARPQDFGVSAPVCRYPAQAFRDTPLIQLPMAHDASGVHLQIKLETGPNNNSFKERVAFFMLEESLKRGEIRPGDTLVIPTAGNTGIALARAVTMWNQRESARSPLKCVVTMPENYPGRRELIEAFGAAVMLTPASQGVEGARRLARQLQDGGLGTVMDQFDHPDSWRVHCEVTARELAGQLRRLTGRVGAIVLPMGSGGLSRGLILGLNHQARSDEALARRLEGVRYVAVVPMWGHLVPGIRQWAPQDRPGNYDPALADQVETVTYSQAKAGSRLFAAHGLLVGPSGGSGLTIASRLAAAFAGRQGAPSLREPSGPVHIVVFACDSGVPYLGTGLYQD